MPTVTMELAKFKPLPTWVPKVGDTIIYHGWLWGRWYGVVNEVGVGTIDVIKAGLPVLLFTMQPDEQDSHKASLNPSRVRSSRGGEYAVIQDGIWFIDAY